MDFSKIWIELCEAAKGIEAEFGTRRALDYIIGEKLLTLVVSRKPLLPGARE